MTLDDARVRLTAALDDPTAARWLTPGDIAALRLVLDALPTQEPTTTLECPCCGDDGAVADAKGEFYDGQRLVCGCNGLVSVDEDDVYISVGIDPCPDGALCHEPSTARALGRDTETPR